MLVAPLTLNFKKDDFFFFFCNYNQLLGDKQVSDDLHHFTDQVTEVCGFQRPFLPNAWLHMALPLVGFFLSLTSQLGSCLSKGPCFIFIESKTAFPTRCFLLPLIPLLALVRSFNFLYDSLLLVFII